MSSKRKLDASELLSSLHPPRLIDELDEEDTDTATLSAVDFRPFFSIFADDDDDEDDDEDRNSAITLSSAVGHMHIDVTDDDPVMPTIVKREEGEIKVKLESDSLSVLPSISSSSRPRVPKSVSFKKEPKQQQFYTNSVGEEHPVFYSTAEITDITRRLSDLYTTLRHVQCQVQVHSLEETDVPIDELKEPSIPVLRLGFIERELCVAVHSSPSSTHSSSAHSSSTHPTSTHSSSVVHSTIENDDDDDNVFSDVKAPPRQYAPCVRGNECVGLTDQWASLYASADDASVSFRGAILPALFYPEEMDGDNGHVAKSRHRPCFFCLIKQIHEMWLVFAVNRLSLYNLTTAPLQCFSNVHGDGEFNRSVLLKPGTHTFNGLVEPILMYVHSKILWDFDSDKKQWRVNIDALKHPKSAVAREPGVVVGPSNPDAKISSKKPLNS